MNESCSTSWMRSVVDKLALLGRRGGIGQPTTESDLGAILGVVDRDIVGQGIHEQQAATPVRSPWRTPVTEVLHHELDETFVDGGGELVESFDGPVGMFADVGRGFADGQDEIVGLLLVRPHLVEPVAQDPP